jgi:hypothetical protein
MESLVASPTVLKDAVDGFNVPSLEKEQGTEFGWYDRQLFAWRDGKVLDYGDWEARDIFEMLAKDYRARQLENVLVLPVTSAERSIVAVDGDKGEQEWTNHFWEADHLNGGCKTSLDQIIDLSTSAFSYKKAFFEKVWREGVGDFEGKFVYDKLGWRPQTTCRLARDPHNGSFAGFEQEAFYVGPEMSKGRWPIEIPAERAFVHIHGLRRDPLNGSSDMEIAYWCYKTKQKIMFLWFQFLENVSLPRIVVHAQDQGVANQIAQQVAKLKGSGVLPLVAGDSRASGQFSIDTLDVSGKGAEQFIQAIQWLDNAAVEQMLAGFLNLTGGVGNGGKAGGSYALSQDASDFFNQLEESKTRELEASIRKHVFAPLVRHNFGPQAKVPKLQFEPLHDEDKGTSVQLLQTLLAQPAQPGQPSPIPSEFIQELAQQVSEYIGLDGKKIRKSFEEAAAKAQKLAEQATPMGGSPIGQQVAGLMGAVGAANNITRRVPNQTGRPPAQPNHPTPPAPPKAA